MTASNANASEYALSIELSESDSSKGTSTWSRIGASNDSCFGTSCVNETWKVIGSGRCRTCSWTVFHPLFGRSWEIGGGDELGIENAFESESVGILHHLLGRVHNHLDRLDNLHDHCGHSLPSPFLCRTGSRGHSPFEAEIDSSSDSAKTKHWIETWTDVDARAMETLSVKVYEIENAFVRRRSRNRFERVNGGAVVVGSGNGSELWGVVCRRARLV